MKNIFEILKEYGLEVPEDKKKDFEKAVLENYKTVSDYEKQTEKVTSLTDHLNGTPKMVYHSTQTFLKIFTFFKDISVVFLGSGYRAFFSLSISHLLYLGGYRHFFLFTTDIFSCYLGRRIKNLTTQENLSEKLSLRQYFFTTHPSLF